MSSDSGKDFSGIEYVFLDRDGVLNRNPAGGNFVTRWEEFDLLPGVPEAICRLNQSGRKAIVITNQRGIALGLFTLEELDRMHERLQATLAEYGGHLDAIYVCPHDAGQCNCRKPLPGLLEQAFGDFPAAKPGNSVMVGDSSSDVEAGARMGMRTVLVTNRQGAAENVPAAETLVKSLLEFVESCLGAGGQSSPTNEMSTRKA